MDHLLHFFVGGIRGAIMLSSNIHLKRMVQPGRVPDGEIGAVGGINYHGQNIPLYSARVLFGFPSIAPRVTDNLIIILTEKKSLALWVEETFIVRDYDNDMTYSSQKNNQIHSIPGIQVFHDELVLVYDIMALIKYNTGTMPLKVKDLVHGWENLSADLDSGFTDLPFTNRSEQVFNILSERADVLALPKEKPIETSNIDLLTFQLLYSEYAIDLRYVRESILTREITPIPGAPDHILGIIAIRGEIIPLIDLRILLNIPEKGLTDLNHAIILTDGAITFGILADQITGIISIPFDQIIHSDSILSPRKAEYIFGLISDSVVMIDAAEILADPDMIVDDSAETYYIPEMSHKKDF